MCMSVPQIELASTSTRTSRRPGLGLGHISYSAPGPGLALTILCISSLDELAGKLLFTAFQHPVKYYWRRSRFHLALSVYYYSVIVWAISSSDLVQPSPMG